MHTLTLSKMVKPHWSQYYGQKDFSDLNRTLGRQCYAIDVDMIAYKYVEPIKDVDMIAFPSAAEPEGQLEQKYIAHPMEDDRQRLDANKGEMNQNMGENGTESIYKIEAGSTTSQSTTRQESQSKQLLRRREDRAIQPCALFDAKNGQIMSISYDENCRILETVSEKLEIPYWIVLTFLEEFLDIKMVYLIPVNEKAHLNGSHGWMSIQEWSQFNHRIRDLYWNPYELSNGKWLKELDSRKAEHPLPKIFF